MDGEVVVQAPAYSRHQDLAGFLTAILGTYAEVWGLGGIWGAPLSG